MKNFIRTTWTSLGTTGKILVTLTFIYLLGSLSRH